MAKTLQFEGTPQQCGDTEVHLPHSRRDLGTYQTVRYGTLTRYCRGVSDGRNFQTILDVHGSAEYPGRFVALVPED